LQDQLFQTLFIDKTPPAQAEIGTGIDLVSTLRQHSAHISRKVLFHLQVAPGEGVFCESRRFECRLEVHPKIHNIRNELSVGLSLVESAHNAVCDAFLATRQRRSASSSIGAHFQST
jgi:hypothetical protein